VEATIRPAHQDDEPALRALDAATWSWDVSPAAPPAPDEAFFRPGTSPQDVLVAVVDGAVVGYVKVGPDIPLESNRHVLQVNGLAVDPAHQGRGIGRRLLDAGVRLAADRGARRLKLRVFAPNVGARRLYESSGFVVEGVLRGEFLRDGRYVDDVLMALDLTGDASA
jgi:ribosomal protein S18 acetylase RimI-like enzyme